VFRLLVFGIFAALLGVSAVIARPDFILGVDASYSLDMERSANSSLAFTKRELAGCVFGFGPAMKGVMASRTQLRWWSAPAKPA
jgi:hypothetical protein